MSSSKRNVYCLLGCIDLGAHMHRFPHPERRAEMFKAWVSIVGTKLNYADPLRIYKNKLICDLHFKPEDKVTGRRLHRAAEPSLFLNGVKCAWSSGLTVQLEHSYSFQRMCNNEESPKITTSAQHSTSEENIPYNANKLENKIAMQCDPANTQRSSVSGSMCVKLSTESGGGVVPQAPPPAAATGTRADVVPTASSSSVRKLTGLVPKRKPKRKKKNAAKRVAAAQTATDSAAAVVNTGGAVLDVGKGQGTKVPSAPSDADRHEQLCRERRKLNATLVNELKRQILEGTLYSPGVSDLAPAFGVAMSRPTRQVEVRPFPPAAVSQITPEPGTHLMELGGERQIGLPLQEAGRLRSTNPNTGSTPETHQPKMSRGLVGVQSGIRSPETSTEPRPAQGKGLRKGRKGKELDHHPKINLTSGSTGRDCSRSGKRQKSSDLVSPSSAAMEKKVRLEGSSTAADAATRAGHKEQEVSDARKDMLYAAVGKSHLRVLITDRSGIHMDYLRATTLRNRLEQHTVEYYLENRQNRGCAKPGFTSIPRLAHGGLRVEAKDDFSLSWLASIVKDLPGLWSGSGGYRVLHEHELPRYYKGVVVVPDYAGDGKSIRDFLSFYNDHLHIETWPIFAHRIQKDEQTTNNVMVFGIPLEEIEALKKTKYRLTYKMATVFVLIRT